MSIAISTAGIKCSYAVEGSDKQRPTTGYTWIKDIKEIPDMNPAPDTLESTTLDNLEFKTYINGLKDLGGALTFVANFTDELLKTWNGANSSDQNSIMYKYNAAKSEGKKMYWCVDIPGISQSIFFTFEPAPIGMPGATTNAVMETNISITPTGEPVWAADPTYAGDDVSAVTFSVTNASSTPVSGATITLNNEAHAITGSDGKAVISVRYGDYFYKVSASGMTDSFGGFTADGVTEAVTVSMTA